MSQACLIVLMNIQVYRIPTAFHSSDYEFFFFFFFCVIKVVLETELKFSSEQLRTEDFPLHPNNESRVSEIKWTEKTEFL